MTEAERLMREDRELRDAARGLVAGDIDRLRGDLAGRGLAERALGRARDGTAEISDDLLGFTRRHKGGIAAGAGLAVVAAVGWMLRDRIADAVYNLAHARDNSSADANEGCESGLDLGEQER